MCSVLALCTLAIALSTAVAEPRSTACPGVDSLDFDTAACFVDSVPVEYPLMAMRARVEGDVVVDVIVLDSGLPCEAVVVSAVNPILNRAATIAASQSRYAPATKDGRPVPGICRVSYGFYVDDPRFERPSWPPAPLTPPLVSELGTVSQKRTREGVEYVEIQYEGVLICGDMPVSLFRDVTAQVAARVDCGGPILRITNFLSLPRDWDPDYIRQWKEMGDIAVDIAESPTESHPERARCVARFSYRNQKFVLSDTVRRYVIH